MLIIYNAPYSSIEESITTTERKRKPQKFTKQTKKTIATQKAIEWLE